MICFERVRYLREKQELTQKMVAGIIHVDKSTYAAWERGRDLFPLKRLIQIANYYQVSLDYLTSQSNEENYPNRKEQINPILLQKRLLIIRKEHGYTQEKLALELNTTHSAISAYENGHLIIPLILLYQLSCKFNISIDWILGMSEQKKLDRISVSV